MVFIVANKNYDKEIEKMKNVDYSKYKQNKLNELYSSIYKLGITYDIKSIRKYYKDWSKAFPIKKVGGVLLVGKEVLVNDKPLSRKLYAESVHYLSVENYRISVPTTRPLSDEDLIHNNVDPNQIKIHLHPDIGSGRISIANRLYSDEFDFKSQIGPSGTSVNGREGDYDNVKGNRPLGERDILVDKNYIYLYNGNKENTIKINR